MSADLIKIATTPNALSTAALVEKGVTRSGRVAEQNGTVCASNEEENSPFCSLASLKEQLSTAPCIGETKNRVPLKNYEPNVDHAPESVAEISQSALSDIDLRQEDGNLSATQISPGLSLLQQTAATSSPPPHSYRHSRPYRHFKNPPQPHMCIRTTNEFGEELFINVLSWTRIVIPQEPSDPIPLYGGMRVPPGSPRSPPIVFAVMANPEVLKDSGRHSKDPEERRAMVELMCDFVEAMNPGVKLIRNAVILKDRDISGELKDVWNAVQAQRDREREEQMLVQRQQHFHHLTNASTNGSLISPQTSVNTTDNITATAQQIFSNAMHISTGADVVLTAVDSGTPPTTRKVIREVKNDKNGSNIEGEDCTNNTRLSFALLTEQLENHMSIVDGEQTENSTTKQANSHLSSNGINSQDIIDIERSCKASSDNQLIAISCSKDLREQQKTPHNGCVTNCSDTDVFDVSNTIGSASTPATTPSIPAQTPQKCITPPTAAQQVPAKKEKLGGFLPNGCIFPRFTKNNKHKDKDKEKESKGKEKEKNVLLSALKKSKDKKSNATAAAATNQNEKNTSSNSNTTATNCNQTNKPQKNCLQQLECGVQKLDSS